MLFHGVSRLTDNLPYEFPKKVVMKFNFLPEFAGAFVGLMYDNPVSKLVLPFVEQVTHGEQIVQAVRRRWNP